MTGDGRQAADLVIRGIDWLITVDEDRRIVTDGAVAVRDGRFVGVGKTAEIDQGFEAATVLDGRRRVATPGLVDAHHHSSFQLARGLADELGTRSFLFERMFPYEGTLSEDDVETSALFAATSLLRSGVTCFVEAGNYHPAATVRGTQAAGIRMVLGRSAFDMTKAVLGILPEEMLESTEAAIAGVEATLELVRSLGDPRVTGSVSFRGLSNASDELIVACKALADRHRCILQTHACFNYATRDDCVAGFGLSEVERLDALGVVDESLLIAHGGWLEPRELAIIVERRPCIVTAPSSSLHNGYGSLLRSRLPELLELGLVVGLGSDHACSGPTDLVQEMFFFSGSQKEVRVDPRVVSPETVVEMATIGGARCAGLQDRIGSIEVGKEADIVLFDCSSPEWQPLYNPISNLVYAATGSSVSEVFVAGEQLLAGGATTRMATAAVIERVQQAAPRILETSGLTDAVGPRWPVS